MAEEFLEAGVKEHKEYDNKPVEFIKFVNTDDKVQGIYRGKYTGDFKGKLPEPVTYYKLETAEKMLFVREYAVIASKMKEVPEECELIITYLGEKQGKNAKKYKDFSVKYR